MLSELFCTVLLNFPLSWPSVPLYLFVMFWQGLAIHLLDLERNSGHNTFSIGVMFMTYGKVGHWDQDIETLYNQVEG